MLTGTAPLDELVAHAATMASFDTEALTLPDAEVFQAMFESHIGGREASLPPSLHPTAVPAFVLQVWRCPDSPWGPFSLAQGRVGARSGLRPRGHMQGCVCDNEVAVDELRARWGFPARSGTVTLHHHYDAVEAAVDVDGHTVLSVRGADPEPSREPGECLALAQVGQDKKRLLPEDKSALPVEAPARSSSRWQWAPARTRSEPCSRRSSVTSARPPRMSA
jgi:hypothetical protein